MPPVMNGAAGIAAVNERGTLPIDPAQASAQPSAARWQTLLGDAIRGVDELWRVLVLPPEALPGARAAAANFKLLVPRGFVAQMRCGDLQDPLLRQVLPLGEELIHAPSYTADPLAEAECAPVPGLLHKYQGRALLVASGACAVHCRYCFRRHYPYDELPRGKRWWEPALGHVWADPSITEVLLSGGDPLTLPDAQLAQLAGDLAGIPHLRRLRIHTRLPVVLPERIDAAFLSWFTGGRLQPVLVIHANHAQELSPAVVAACQRLRAAGVTVLSQSVLLRGVNDRVEDLAQLSEALIASGVVPYYLHVLDRVQGAAHFLVADDEAKDLLRALAARLPGYLVPRLVREEPGASGKTPIPW